MSMFDQYRFSAALLALTLALAVGTASAQTASKLKIVTTTTDLASLAQAVGGDRVEVNAIARGYQDPHFVEAKPSFLLQLRRADLLIVVGLQLEIGWLPPLITQSGNPRIQTGAGGYLDASRFAQILEVPTEVVTRAMGDVHPFGNPHYWLNPGNGRRIAQGLQQKLASLRPADAECQQRRQAWDDRRAQAEKNGQAMMAPYRGRKVVTYHRSWPNFLNYLGLLAVGEVEPRPGIPPTPSHTIELIRMMKRDNVKIILVEPYFDP